MLFLGAVFVDAKHKRFVSWKNLYTERYVYFCFRFKLEPVEYEDFLKAKKVFSDDNVSFLFNYKIKNL